MLQLTLDGYHRITKTEAARRYNAGEVIRMTACKMHPCNLWGAYVDAQKDNYTEVSGDGFNTTVARNREFDTVVNAFMYYNCNNEVGRYPAYWTVNA